MSGMTSFYRLPVKIHSTQVIMHEYYMIQLKCYVQVHFTQTTLGLILHKLPFLDSSHTKYYFQIKLIQSTIFRKFHTKYYFQILLVQSYFQIHLIQGNEGIRYTTSKVISHKTQMLKNSSHTKYSTPTVISYKLILSDSSHTNTVF